MEAVAVVYGYHLLQEISNAAGSIREPQELFRTVTEKLRVVFRFDSAAIVTFDKAGAHSHLFFDMLQFELPAVIDRQRRLLAGSWLERHLSDVAVSVIGLEAARDRYPAEGPLLELLREHGMRQVALVPLRTGGELIGFLCLLLRHDHAWDQQRLSLLQSISFPVAMAVSNALAYDELRQREAQTAMQLAVNNALLTIKDRNSMLHAVCEQISTLVPCYFIGIRLMGHDGRLHIFENFMRQPDGSFQSVASVMVLAGLAGQQDKVNRFHQEGFDLIAKAGCYNGEEFERLSERYGVLSLVREKFGINSLMTVPLWDSEESRAGLIISDTSRKFDERAMATIELIVPQLVLALRNFLAFEQIDELRRKLEGERTCLIEEITAEHNFGEIIGNSRALKGVLQRLRQVAPTEATVLIQGETGTGKELFARALHNLSPRSKRALVKVNCAALPAALIESELFGHERGSFTGASERRIGKFELAEGGTIFLDEIGELPMESQAKLLRVLQEREVERVGGRTLIRVDVRVIAATNRNLVQEVAAGRFREDLFFRLNVFPLLVPALRDRSDDIPMLAAHFASKFSRECGKPLLPFRESDVRRLVARTWKGNVRELAHLVEQAVIVSDGPVLDVASLLAPVTPVFPEGAAEGVPTMQVFEEEMLQRERELVLMALRQSNGRVSGVRGAAELLGMHPKTLYSRMGKLGLSKRYE